MLTEQSLSVVVVDEVSESGKYVTAESSISSQSMLAASADAPIKKTVKKEMTRIRICFHPDLVEDQENVTHSILSIKAKKHPRKKVRRYSSVCLKIKRQFQTN
jgi:hypothetical protein